MLNLKESQTFDPDFLVEISVISGLSKPEVLRLYEDRPYCDVLPDPVARKAAMAKAISDYKAIKKLPSQIPFEKVFYAACHNWKALTMKISPFLTKHLTTQMYLEMDAADRLSQQEKSENLTQDIKKLEQNQDRWDRTLMVVFMDWKRKHLPCFELILRRSILTKEEQWQQIADDYINNEGFSNLEHTRQIFKKVSVNNLKQRYHRCLEGLIEEARKKFYE